LAYLIAALAATAAGPLLYGILHDRPGLRRHVDGFVYVVVPVLVTWQILSVAWERRSIAPLLALGAGTLLPMWIGRASLALRQRTDAVALGVVMSGLLVHSLIEGAALAPLAAGRVGAALGIALVLHRVVEGLVVWWILRPARGAPTAFRGLTALLLTTTLGFAVGGELLGGAQGAAVDVFEALVAGSLLHVVFHQGRHAHAHADDHGR
jgi:zinc transporter ZupT